MTINKRTKKNSNKLKTEKCVKQLQLFNINVYDIKEGDILSTMIDKGFFIVSKKDGDYCWGLNWITKSYSFNYIPTLIMLGYRKYKHPLIDLLKESELDARDLIGGYEHLIDSWLTIGENIISEFRKKNISNEERLKRIEDNNNDLLYFLKQIKQTKDLPSYIDINPYPCI